jgi:hypothetical protein
MSNKIKMINMLQKIGEISFPGRERFVVSESFVIDTSGDTPVKISYLGKNFPSWFLDKVESSLLPSELMYSVLTESANDTEIVSFLGGEEKVETYLAEMFYLMSLQPNGEEGVLLNNGDVNFFYVRDTSDTLRTIRVLWQDGGWGIHAIRPLDVQYLPVWKEGSRVFSKISTKYLDLILK